MLVSKKTIALVILCTFIFSVSVPVLLGARMNPQELFNGESDAVLSQVSQKEGLYEDLAWELDKQEFVSAVSPEIFAFTTIKSGDGSRMEPVLVRGAYPGNFFGMENATLAKGSLNGSGIFTLFGQGVARRLGVDVGDSVTLTGSVRSILIEVTVTGIFRSDGPVNDEIVIPLKYARKMAGLESNAVLTIRVMTEDMKALESYLRNRDESVVVGSGQVGGGDPGSTTINSNQTYEEGVAKELVFKYFKPENISLSQDSYISTFVQKGAGSISIVVTGFIVLNGFLAFIGMAAIFTRNVLERKKDIGILSAIGANWLKIHLMLLKDILAISALASVIGMIMGITVAVIVGESDMLMAFGHAIQPEVNTGLIVIILLTSIGIGCLAGIFVMSFILKTMPHQLMQEAGNGGNEGPCESLTECLEV